MNIAKVGRVSEPVKTRRPYTSQKRTEQALLTRRQILDAARALFAEQGYALTTVGQIAARAGVNVDTVYASVGRKPEVMTLLVETAISGQDTAVPAREREYVQRIEAAGDAAEKLALYADALAAIQQRMAPTFLALRDAALTDEHCRALWERIGLRRAANMRQFAASLRSTGQLRPDLTDEQVADVIWSMNAAEYWDLLVTQRGWSPAQFRDWIVDAWSRWLLA